MPITPKDRFLQRVNYFIDNPKGNNFTHLMAAALQLMPGFERIRGKEEPESCWIKVDGNIEWGYFTRIKVVGNRALSLPECSQIAAAIGYAFKQHIGNVHGLNGEFAVSTTANQTVLEFEYDTREHIRTTPNFDEAFAHAEQYIMEGSPVRLTNREGPKGTRLVQPTLNFHPVFYVCAGE